MLAETDYQQVFGQALFSCHIQNSLAEPVRLLMVFCHPE